MSTIVIMPGGFHPFHAGHADLYQQAKKAFPGADIYVAATNDQSERPFPFALKEKLAKLAGVESGHFVQVKSPFQAKEITQHYNPEQDVLIFVRSEKDRNEPPKPGGTKKDGSPAYFQPYTGKDLQPFSQHAYIDYLKTVEFGPGITSATQIRNAWPNLDDRRKTAMVMSLYPAAQKNLKLAQNVVGMFDQVMGGQVAEAINDADRVSKGKPTSDDVRRKYWDKTVSTTLGGKSSDSEKKKAWDRYQKIGKVTDPELFKEQGVAEGYSNTTFNVDRRKLNVPALIQKGAILVTHPHGEQGWETDNKEDWAFSLLSLYNVLQGGWPSEAKKYLKPQSYKRAEQQINSSAPNLGSDKLVYDGKYNQILWSIKKLGIPDNVAFLDKDKQGMAEGAPIVVMPRADRLEKPEPTKVRYQGDIVPPIQPPSTEKRGVKGRSGQRPMPDYTKVSEGFGINYPSTYDQENANFKSHGQRRVGTLTTENIDPELINVLQYAQQHYPNSRNKQEAFMKFVQRALGHSRSDDERQDNELERLDKEVDQLQKKVNMSESTDYLEEK